MTIILHKPKKRKEVMGTIWRGQFGKMMGSKAADIRISRMFYQELVHDILIHGLIMWTIAAPIMTTSEVLHIGFAIGVAKIIPWRSYGRRWVGMPTTRGCTQRYGTT